MRKIEIVKSFRHFFSIRVFDNKNGFPLKFVYSVKATKFCKISTLILSEVHTDKVEILQNFEAFSKFMNYTYTVVCDALKF